MGEVIDFPKTKRQSVYDDWASSRVKKGLTTPAYCDPANEFVGSNYDPGLDVKEIAKRLRKAFKSEFSGFKFSVRISRYSGGQSVDCYIKAIPGDVALYNPDYVEYLFLKNEYPAGGDAIRLPKYSEVVSTVRSNAQLMLDSYRRDNSDSMSDYFDTNFYGRVSIDIDEKPRLRLEG